MKFGAVQANNPIDFSLPQTRSFLNQCGTNSKLTVFTGGPGWSDPRWKKVLPKLNSGQSGLEAYSNFFRSIEFNGSFYKLPEEHQIQTWLKDCPDHFKFCPKLSQSISQSRDLACQQSIWEEWNELTASLKERLGSCFIQLPERFKRSELKTLERLLCFTRIDFPLLWEFRNSTWFEDYGVMESICSLLQQFGFGMVITDTPGRRDVLHCNLSVPQLMIRFVSSGNESVDLIRMEHWKNKFREWKECGVQEIYFFFHHPNFHFILEHRDYFQF